MWESVIDFTKGTWFEEVWKLFNVLPPPPN